MFYKIIENNTIEMIGESSVIPQTAEEITEEKYNQLLSIIQNKPAETLETKYFLSNETEEYIGRETTHAEKAEWYVLAILSEQMTIDEVPTEYKAEVEAKLPTPQPEKYTLDEAAELLTQEVADEV